MGASRHSVIQPEVAVYDETAVIPRYVVDMEISYDKIENQLTIID